MGQLVSRGRQTMHIVALKNPNQKFHEQSHQYLNCLGNFYFSAVLSGYAN